MQKGPGWARAREEGAGRFEIAGNLEGKHLHRRLEPRHRGKAIGSGRADGANIVIAAKWSPCELQGTIHPRRGGRAAGVKAWLSVDVRREEDVERAVNLAVETFGGIDILVNNASAIRLTGTLETPMKVFDLLHAVNTRGTFLCSRLCIPHLKKASNPHILNISPPLNNEARGSRRTSPNSVEYGMSFCVLAMAGSSRGRDRGQRLCLARSLDRRRGELLGGAAAIARSRNPEIMADAAHES